MSEKKLFKVGINQKIINKPGKIVSTNLAENWQPMELTLDGFIGHVRKGHAFSAHYRERYRKTANFICSDVVAADVDGGMTIAEALEIPFVRDNAAFLYTTPSHTDEHPRFRIVFLLEETIDRSQDWADCLLGLAVKVDSDRSIKDAGRMFYGSRGAEIHKLGKMLPPHEAQALISMGADTRARSDKSVASSPMRASVTMNPDEIVRTASGAMIAFKDLAERTSVLCPYHLDTRPSAFVLKSRIGSTGIHCMSCHTTFWADEPDSYDFDMFDGLVREQLALDERHRSEHAKKDDFFEQLFPPAPSVELLHERFLPRLSYRPGITMIKSPKGSGKTEALKALLSGIKKGEISRDIEKAERPKSVLLIGHRRSLIREAAKKLGLTCYLDAYESDDMRSGFATCLDSLHYVTDPNAKRPGASRQRLRYDVVILDESEQVFSHLTSETLSEKNNTVKAFDALTTAIQQAKAVYALDADLGMITAHVLKQLRPRDWESDCRIILNEPVDVTQRRTMRVYNSRTDLENQLVQAVKDGKRCFVASNSRKAVDTLEELILRRCGKDIKLRKITSDNSQKESERDFVLNIATQYLEIQVLLCSPSLGTGIDITFPNGEQKVDHVFGFFRAGPANLDSDISGFSA